MDEVRRVETVAVHAGNRVDPATGAVISPIHMSTTFRRNADGGYTDGLVYGRSDNPNRRALEECLAALEGGEVCAAFASGMAACAAILAALRPGDHMLLPEDVYHGVRSYVREFQSAWGLAWDSVDMTDVRAVRAALQPSTRLIWVETPSNPSLRISDIPAIAAIAHEHGALCVCDNTWATPIATRPLALGADLVMHSSTKYLGGHSDVMGGAVIAARDDDFFARVRAVQTMGGAVPSPFDCWLLLRSIRTLPWRMRAHTQNALALARALESHPAISKVHYPGLASHPGHEVAARQMALYGGMLSIEVRGGAAEAIAVTNRVRLFTVATSLGGVESLIEHRASVEGPLSPTPPTLLRISVGLEHPDDLIEDLLQALGEAVNGDR